MQDRKVSVSVSLACVAAWSAWVVAVALMGSGTLMQREDLGFWALGCVGAAVVLHVRCYCIQLSRNMRAAFELGRETAGASNGLRSIE